MITLAIECATDTVSLALLQGEEVRAELYLGAGRHHAELLLPAMQKLLDLSGIAIEQVDLLACTNGPGSFTGVRMGVSTVKGIALASEKPIVGVSTLETLAMNALPARGLVCALLDARREQVYAGVYRTGLDGFPEAVVPERLTDIAQLLAELPADGVDFVGDGALRYHDRILGSHTGRCVPDGNGFHRLQASAVGLIGLRRYSRCGGVDPLTFSPKYLRVSEAEARLGGSAGF